MRYFPAFLDIRGKDVLVVGGGAIAARKIKLILAAGGLPRVVAPRIHADIATLVKQGGGSLALRAFEESDLDGVCLVFSATDNKRLSKRIYALATTKKLQINSVDSPTLCSFIMPALVDRDPLTIAFATGGGAPIVARRLRAEMEARLPTNYGELVNFLASLRPRVKKNLPEEARRAFYESLLDSAAPNLVLRGRAKEAAKLVSQLLKRRKAAKMGEVWLAGAGPGGAELLTLQTLRLMHLADVILYDRLVSADILRMARRDAEMIAVGKPGKSQAEINRLLVRHAKKGRFVLRLKGGDPGIYGRLAEEIEYLKKASVSFHLAPGLTAALACAAYGGIPLTHRQLARGVSFISLQSAAPKRAGAKPVLAPQTSKLLEQFAQSEQTIVIYMGVELIAEGVKELMNHGMASAMPALVVESVGFDNQRVTRSALNRLPAIVSKQKVQPPTTFIIGKVCASA